MNKTILIWTGIYLYLNVFIGSLDAFDSLYPENKNSPGHIIAAVGTPLIIIGIVVDILIKSNGARFK